MTKFSTILALLAASAATASAGGPAISGIYKIKFGEYPGTMQVVQDGDFVCGTYKGDDGGGGGWLGGKLENGKVTGLQTSWAEESSGGFPIELAFSGKNVTGTFKEDSKSEAKPWTGSLSAALPKTPSVSGDYSVEMGGDKIVIHLKPAGDWKGTIVGNMVVGTWDEDKNHGRFQWTFSLNKLTWLVVDGTYGVDRDHCDNGGTIKGGRKTK